MKSAAGGIILTIVLFVAAVACWAEARMARGMAEAHRRLATLHYDADDRLDESKSAWTQLPWPAGTSESDVQRQRATVSYWRTQYQSLTDLKTTGARALTDPQVMLVAANAAFRSATPDVGDRKAAVSRLDLVIQQYADVLRRDPNATDAAYNYEFVSRLRDTLAKAPARHAPPEKKADKSVDTTVDLPAGPTIHGDPGGPPPGTDMSDFKTISPMRYDEREEQMEPGRGRELKRKG